MLSLNQKGGLVMSQVGSYAGDFLGLTNDQLLELLTKQINQQMVEDVKQVLSRRLARDPAGWLPGKMPIFEK